MAGAVPPISSRFSAPRWDAAAARRGQRLTPRPWSAECSPVTLKGRGGWWRAIWEAALIPLEY